MSDPRSHAWQFLFTPTTTWVDSDSPATAKPAAEGPLVLVLGSATPPADLAPFTAVVSTGTSVSASALRRAGFDWVRRFAVVPGHHDPRFLIPLHSPAVATGALQLYTPLTRKGRALHRAATLAARAHLPGWYRGELLVGSRETPFLPATLAHHLHLSDCHLAFSNGLAHSQDKTTIGLLDAAGRARAFAKCARRPAPAGALRNEASWLSTLASTSLASSVPGLVWADTEAEPAHARIAVSPGPLAPSPRTFSPAHQRWLDSLADATRELAPFSASSVAARVDTAWPRLAPCAYPAWRLRLDRAVHHLRCSFGTGSLPLSAAHGDFAPWNVRLLPDGDLFVFDWETARARALPLHDRFHFDFIQAALSHAPLAPAEAPAWISARARGATAPPQSLFPALFAGYLIDLALDFLEFLDARGGSADDPVLDSVARLLDSPVWWPTPEPLV